MNYTPTPEELALLHEVEQLDVLVRTRTYMRVNNINNELPLTPEVQSFFYICNGCI
ncbi:hypothetical protein ALC60_06675 [Trachymyrmex zeteki]|uniref:Uncharacterized protein n=1 Tax=Mycetomoellerius zeteki TaxID=64791 RepID=A0A151X215_9HYME|nr:hypothetical protein ALC60_06675 [Trachymyrmex zeteki]